MRANSAVYAEGDEVVANTMGTRMFECLGGGTSAASEPAAFGTAATDDIFNDGTVRWKCHNLGDRGNIKLTDGTDTIILCSDVDIAVTVGKPNLKHTRRGAKKGTTSAGRFADVWNHRTVWQIEAVLRGPRGYTETKTLFDMIRQSFGSGSSAVTLTYSATGVWNTMFGSGYTLVPDGSTALKIPSIKGKRHWVEILLQLVEVKQS